MNKVITSEDAILSVCRNIVAESGLQSINIRDVAKKCGGRSDLFIIIFQQRVI